MVFTMQVITAGGCAALEAWQGNHSGQAFPPRIGHEAHALKPPYAFFVELRPRASLCPRRETPERADSGEAFQTPVDPPETQSLFHGIEVCESVKARPTATHIQPAFAFARMVFRESRPEFLAVRGDIHVVGHREAPRGGGYRFSIALIGCLITVLSFSGAHLRGSER